MDELRVPKRRTPVEVVLPGGAVRQVVVFLSEFASDHVGAERFSDVLNGSDDFFPAVEQEGDRMVFFNRYGIAAARVAPEVEADAHAADGATIPTEHEVEITLMDGTGLLGLVTYVLPPDRSRLNDFLNEAPPFFKVLEEGRISLVNKRHVSRVVALKR
jgi:hypothetical protein